MIYSRLRTDLSWTYFYSVKMSCQGSGSAQSSAQAQGALTDTTAAINRNAKPFELALLSLRVAGIRDDRSIRYACTCSSARGPTGERPLAAPRPAPGRSPPLGAAIVGARKTRFSINCASRARAVDHDL